MNNTLIDHISSFVGNNDVSEAMVDKKFGNKSSDVNFDSFLKPNSPSNQHTSVLCFSKNRPYQLHQLLQSMNKFISPRPNSIIVLYSSSEQFQSLYNVVIKLNTEVIFVKQINFQSDLIACVEDIIQKSCNSSSNHSIMFCVDDLIFLDNLSIR